MDLAMKSLVFCCLLPYVFFLLGGKRIEKTIRRHRFQREQKTAMFEGHHCRRLRILLCHCFDMLISADSRLATCNKEYGFFIAHLFIYSFNLMIYKNSAVFFFLRRFTIFLVNIKSDAAVMWAKCWGTKADSCLIGQPFSNPYDVAVDYSATTLNNGGV